MRLKSRFFRTLQVGLCSFILTGIGASLSLAVSPSLVEYRDNVNWSRVQF